MIIGLLDIEQSDNSLDINNNYSVSHKYKGSGLLGQITCNKKNCDSKTNKERDNIHHSHKGLLDVEIK
jgi:hypothetical protein